MKMFLFSIAHSEPRRGRRHCHVLLFKALRKDLTAAPLARDDAVPPQPASGFVLYFRAKHEQNPDVDAVNDFPTAAFARETAAKWKAPFLCVTPQWSMEIQHVTLGPADSH